MANLELSRKRAQSVIDYLLQKGIKTTRLQAKGYG
jgi:peptidoglycan-associated lipoprotein